VLVLLVGIGVAGLAWVVLDRWLVPLVRSGLQRAQPGGAPDRRTVRLLRGLSLAWLVLPAVVWLMGFVWRPLAFVLFPVSIGAGLLLMLYAAHLRQLDAPSDDATRRRNAARQVSGALLVGVCLFWTAANYAQVQGVQLARQTAQQIDRLPGVVVYSRSPLHLDGPGVAETDLSGPSGNLRYRYRGLRLFEHTAASTSSSPTDGLLPTESCSSSPTTTPPCGSTSSATAGDFRPKYARHPTRCAGQAGFCPWVTRRGSEHRAGMRGSRSGSRRGFVARERQTALSTSEFRPPTCWSRRTR
jgi:hypothetical protein